MADYWISDDWKVKVETLEHYLASTSKRGMRDHTVHADVNEWGDAQFSIHPAGYESQRVDYKALDNRVYPADPAFGPPHRERMICYMRTKDGFRLAEMSTFTARVNSLDDLYSAVRREDQDGIKQAMEALREQDEESGWEDDE